MPRKPSRVRSPCLSRTLKGFYTATWRTTATAVLRSVSSPRVICSSARVYASSATSTRPSIESGVFGHARKAQPVEEAARDLGLGGANHGSDPAPSHASLSFHELAEGSACLVEVAAQRQS